MSALFGAWLAVALLGVGAGLATRADRAVAGRVQALAVSPPFDPARPTSSRVLGRIARSRLVSDKRLHRRLAQAGIRGGVEAHARRKLWWAAAGVLAGGVLGGAGWGGTVLGLILAVAGFRLPDVWLARRAARRQAAIVRDAADLFDLVGAGVSTGLGPAAALELAAAELDGPLGDELQVAVRAVAMGTRWSDALDALVARTEAPSLGRFRSALAQTERLGASLERVLRDLARDARTERRRRSEARARVAPVKLLFPLVFLILPAFLLLTVVPVVLATVRSL